MLTSELDYELPDSAIAQTPLRRRDLCKLCVVDRQTDSVDDRRFKDLEDYLHPGDLLVLNDTRVLPCRIPCTRQDSGGSMEIFLLDPPGEPRRRFHAFFKPARRAKAGHIYLPVRDPNGGAFEVIAQNGELGGEVEWKGPQALDASRLGSLGVMPLPPYIKRPRLPDSDVARVDARYYQSIYAAADGSAAAPTAGLHFSRALIARLKKKGVQFCSVTLHVGAGTFLPVKGDSLDTHVMHSEPYSLSQETADRIREAKATGRRVIAVGTTAVRVLESYGSGLSGSTNIFIKPGYRFKNVDALITNFHQPKSTLMALVGAFYDTPKILALYKRCLAKGYRFLSYGDAMFIQ
ncbi:MAG: tRNA preQ1(34) S-adenosylmethionine ribosyltransferase-isomerase QueA [candidate division FCPU426 bacterium]